MDALQGRVVRSRFEGLTSSAVGIHSSLKNAKINLDALKSTCWKLVRALHGWVAPLLPGIALDPHPLTAPPTVESTSPAEA
jgi:hypothetical protein